VETDSAKDMGWVASFPLPADGCGGGHQDRPDGFVVPVLDSHPSVLRVNGSPPVLIPTTMMSHRVSLGFSQADSL